MDVRSGAERALTFVISIFSKFARAVEIVWKVSMRLAVRYQLWMILVLIGIGFELGSPLMQRFGSPPFPFHLSIYGLVFIVAGLLLPKALPIRAIQVIIVIAGLMLAALHAVQNGVWPLLIDSLTYTGIAIAIFGLIFNRIKGFKYGDASVDLMQEVVANTDFQYGEAVDFIQTTAITLSVFNRECEAVESAEEAGKLLIRYCTETLNAALPVISLQDETVRLSVWVYNDAVRELQFLVSNDEGRNKKYKRSFKIGEGLIGQTFVENATYSSDDAPNEPYYLKGDGNPRYHGLVMVPIRYGNNTKVGMLSVDRTTKAAFSEEAIRVITALAHLTSVALTNPSLRRWITPGPTLD